MYMYLPLLEAHFWLEARIHYFVFDIVAVFGMPENIGKMQLAFCYCLVKGIECFAIASNYSNVV